MPGASPSPSHRPAESIVVHGADRLAASAVGAALARRGRASFAWADCAEPSGGAALPVRSWVERHVGRPVVERVDLPLLRLPDLERVLLRHVLIRSDGPEDGQLLNHFAMPELFQRLAARAVSRNGRGSILLVNVDVLPVTVRTNTLETARLHQTLHEEGLTVVLTSRAPPSDEMRRVVESVFRVDVPDDGPWVAGWLTEEKGGSLDDGRRTLPLRAAWGRFRLDPDLLGPS